MTRRTLLITVLFLAAACRHSAESAPPRAMAHFDFTPVAGSASLVVYRNVAGFMAAGSGVNTTVTVDGKVLGDLAQDHYAVIEVLPGEHTINFQGASGVSNVIVNVAAGDVRYYAVQTYPTLSNAPRDQPDAMKDLDNEGETLVQGFKYSFSSSPGAPSGPTNSL